MHSKTIEGAYQEFIDRVSTDFNYSLAVSRLGEHLTKNMWVCSASYFWTRMKSLLQVEPEDNRSELAYGIRHEIENPYESNTFKRFHCMCSPDEPTFYMAITWKFSGRAVRDIGTPIVELPPSKRRTMLIETLEFELKKLRTLWMLSIADPRHN